MLCTHFLEEFPETEIPPIEEFIEMTIGNEEEITTPFPERDDFDEKINEVMTMLTDSENKNMSPSNFKSLLGSLVETVNQESRTSEEHSEKMGKVGNLVNVFMHENAQRAQKTMDDRKPKINPCS